MTERSYGNGEGTQTRSNPYGQPTDQQSGQYGQHDHDNDQPRLGQIFPFLIAAIAVGVVAALLFAPREEEDPRHKLQHEVDHRLDHGRDSLEHAIKRLEKDFSDLRKRVEDRVS